MLGLHHSLSLAARPCLIHCIGCTCLILVWFYFDCFGICSYIHSTFIQIHYWHLGPYFIQTVSSLQHPFNGMFIAFLPKLTFG